MLGQIDLGVGADVVLFGRFVEAGDQAHGVVEHGDDMREGIAEESRDAHGHVDPGPSQLGERDGLQVDDAPGRVVPHRPDTQQRKDFGDVVARGAHRRGAPHTERPTDRGQSP